MALYYSKRCVLGFSYNARTIGVLENALTRDIVTKELGRTYDDILTLVHSAGLLLADRAHRADSLPNRLAAPPPLPHLWDCCGGHS